MDEELAAVEAAGVVQLTLQRPHKRNALTRSLLTRLLSELRRVAASADVRALVLRGAGPVFCAGMDLSEMQEVAQVDEADARGRWRQDAELYRDVLWELCTLAVPTVAVVQGPVLAGGVGLVLACDLVLASPAAAFALPEPRRGITAAIVTPLLIYRLGAGPAGQLLLSGRTWSADDAVRHGLVHQLAATEQLAVAEQELLTAILSGASEALAATKRHLLACAGETLRQQLERSAELSAAARETEAAREGLAAFLEKRTPAWMPPDPASGLNDANDE